MQRRHTLRQTRRQTKREQQVRRISSRSRLHWAIAAKLCAPTAAPALTCKPPPAAAETGPAASRRALVHPGNRPPMRPPTILLALLAAPVSPCVRDGAFVSSPTLQLAPQRLLLYSLPSVEVLLPRPTVLLISACRSVPVRSGLEHSQALTKRHEASAIPLPL